MSAPSAVARRAVALAAVLGGAGALGACGDLAAPADRVPAGIEFEQWAVTVTEGETVDLRPYVVDQHGQRIERLPVWAEVRWETTDQGIFDPTGAGLLAVGPGLAHATATIAELSGQAMVRVNPTALAITVPHAYVVQSVQRPDGSVPLVAGRAATLRIFVTGHVHNFFQPEAEATFYHDGEEVGSRRVALTGDAGVPGSINEGTFTGSWAVDMPAEWVQPGLSFVVSVDPDEALPVIDRAGTRFPADGARPVDVREVPDLELRFVPIRQTAFGSTGDISSGTAALWTRFLEDVFPISGITRDVRQAFHTDAAIGGQSDWFRIINEIRTLRILDDDDRFYYGVLRRHGGPAGLGYVGLPVAIGWDYFGTVQNDPIPLAYSVFAHELGHNFGRQHAPSCGAGNPDGNFPHIGGVAGVFGLHRTPNAITRPSDPDLMGYCNPHWVSDYTYEGVLDFRIHEEEGRRRSDLDHEAGPGLLVWGSVRDGVVSLEPAIALERARAAPEPTGDLMIEGLDAGGGRIFSHPAAIRQHSHGPPGWVAFSTVVPLASPERERLHTIRVTGAGVREGTRRGRLSASPGEARALAAGRAAAFADVAARANETELVWDAQRYPLLVVRDSDTGNVIAFARRGRIALPTPAHRLTFDLSDGVRSVRARPEIR